MFTTPFAFMAAPVGGGYDPDAQAYIDAVVAAGGTLSSPNQDAVNTLFVDMKTAGVYAKMDAFWPIVGGVAASNAINANLDPTYDLTYNGTWTHDASGQTPNASNGWADTGWTFPPSSFDNSFGVYVTTNSTSSGYGSDMGTTDNVSYFWLAVYWPSTDSSRWWNVNQSQFGSTGPNGGLMINTRTSISNWRGYLNGSLDFTNTTAATGNAAVPNIILGAINYPTGPNFYSGRKQIFAFVGQGLSDTEATDFATAINTFETALGRNVY